MKIEISQEALLNSLKIVARAVSNQNPLPVLGNILIKAEHKKIYFSATNLDISISTSTEAIVKNEGSITVPSKIFTSYVSLIDKNENIELNVIDGTTLEVTTKSSKTKIKGILSDEFPIIKPVASGTKIELSIKNFRTSVSQVSFSANENASRAILTGVFFGIDKNQVRIAATDSYRLSENILKLENSVDKIDSIIPVRAILEADRLAANHSGKISITISENQVMFVIGGTELVSRLIEGNYPDYTAIIPKSNSTEIEVNREKLESAVRRVSIFAKQDNQHMKLSFSNDGNCVISTNQTEIGEEKITIPVKIKGKTNNNIALNADYFLDILTALTEEEIIKIFMENEEGPAIIKKIKDQSYTHLIMSLKI